MTHTWLEILSTINADNDLNRDNIIGRITGKLKAIDSGTYEKWKKAGFYVNHIIDSVLDHTLLHLAVRRGYTKIVEALIEKGASVHVVNRTKQPSPTRRRVKIFNQFEIDHHHELAHLLV